MPEGREKSLSLERKKEIFAALVEAQDGNMTVAQSRQAMAKKFGISESEIKRIEQEGLDGQWPPLR
jgi:hypothetical protein